MDRPSPPSPPTKRYDPSSRRLRASYAASEGRSAASSGMVMIILPMCVPLCMTLIASEGFMADIVVMGEIGLI